MGPRGLSAHNEGIIVLVHFKQYTTDNAASLSRKAAFFTYDSPGFTGRFRL